MVAEPWWSSWEPSLASYAVLLRLFVDGRVDAEEFEVVFLKLYKSDPISWPTHVFGVLERFFGDVDLFCADPELRGLVHGIDEGELRCRAKIALEGLQATSTS